MKKLFAFLIVLIALSGVLMQNSRAAVRYVTITGSGTKDGSSWANAFEGMQAALNVAVFGDQVWVVKGTYKPSYDYGLGGGSRYNHFRMINGVAIYGGFAGTETNISQRTNFGHSEINETILSADIGVEGDNTDNCYHVFYHPEGMMIENATTALDGFTFSGGNANGSSFHAYGGAIMNGSWCLYKISNCTFTSNSGRYGAAIYNHNYSSPIISNCLFSSNSATSNSGAIYNYLYSSPAISNCTFLSNSALAGAGALGANRYASPTIINCIFISNSASNVGGALAISYNSSPVFTNCTFSMNSSSLGGGVYVDNSFLTFNNCIIWGNTSSNGIQFYIDGGSANTATVTMNYSCYSNDPNDVYLTRGGLLTATNNCITIDPLFAGVALNPAYPYSILGISPCTDAGSDSYNSQVYDIRGAGFPRKLNKTTGATGTIDMGAYEYKYGADPYVMLTWTGETNNSWETASNWAPTMAPTLMADITVPDVSNDPIIGGTSAECKSLTIQAGGVITIDAGKTLTVSGALANSNGPAGLVINSEGTLIQNNSGVSATVNRTISDATDDKWHLFISPIEESIPASIGSCFEGAYVDGYNESIGAWERLVTDDDVTSGQGYAINYLTGSRDLVFAGTLMSSPVSYTDLSFTPSSVIDPNYTAGWHLVGNPYPCGIAPALFSLPTNMNAFAYVWDGGNYVTPTIGTADIPGTIASLQGFFVRTTDASNDLTLDNAAKVHGGTFYKSSNSVAQMLSLSIAGNNYSDKTYVRFNTEATANFDQAFDAYKRAGLDAAPQLYSILPTEKAAVNTLPDYTTNSNVALGLKVGASTSYTINVSGIESFDASLPVRLDDLKLGTSQDLRLNPVYTFDAAPGDAENRFLLSFASVTAVNELNASGIRVVSDNGIIRVTHNAPATGTVYLYS
ncbi:MAG: right-handed parallel beta-helix repeat-containing protein, partial [Bacteroidales bacterium]|nr:right-handed parallel beta-helix repeat-containing protein [Bacteroidales bacterium]